MTKNKKKLAKFERNNKEIMRNINHIYIYFFCSQNKKTQKKSD